MNYPEPMPPNWRPLIAGRADAIPAGESGLWYVEKMQVSRTAKNPNGQRIARGHYTGLYRWTEATIHLTGGECVMIDHLPELSKHLEPAMKAEGRVLVTGLGLGCVLRMLQANSRVTHITVVEISQDVIDLVWPHTPHHRCELVHADAVEFLRGTKERWDFAWHDVWTDPDRGEPHLQVRHQELLSLGVTVADWQGAWAFPRRFRRAFERVVAEIRSEQPPR